MQKELKKWRKDIWLSLTPTLPGRYVGTTVARRQARLRALSRSVAGQISSEKSPGVHSSGAVSKGLNEAKTLIASPVALQALEQKVIFAGAMWSLLTDDKPEPPPDGRGRQPGSFPGQQGTTRTCMPWRVHQAAQGTSPKYPLQNTIPRQTGGGE